MQTKSLFFASFMFAVATLALSAGFVAEFSVPASAAVFPSSPW